MSKQQKQARASEAKPMSDEAKAASDELMEKNELLTLVYKQLLEMEDNFTEKGSPLKKEIQTTAVAIIAVQNILENCNTYG